MVQVLHLFHDTSGPQVLLDILEFYVFQDDGEVLVFGIITRLPLNRHLMCLLILFKIKTILTACWARRDSGSVQPPGDIHENGSKLLPIEQRPHSTQ